MPRFTAFELVGVTCLGMFLILLEAHGQGLTDAIYKNYDGDPCVVLLDKDGSYGCRTSKGGVASAMELVTDAELWLKSPPTDAKILVMPLSLYATENLFLSLEKSEKCLGIIFIQDEGLRAASDEGIDEVGLPQNGQSDSLTIPQSVANSDNPSLFKWNPHGSGNLYKKIPFPVWKLGLEDSKHVVKLAMENSEKSGKYPVNGAEITAYMHPARNDNSMACLKRETCKPIGGHSTWTSLTDLTSEKKTILVMSSMDGASLFQQQTPSANSDMSGLVAILAVIDALSVNGSLSGNVDIRAWADHQVVFSLFDAENYGYLGSKQFIREVDAKNPDFTNVSIANMSHIVELKQVGSIDATGLFIHSENDDFGLEVKSFGGEININIGDTKITGMPPSSLKSFAKAKSAGTKSLVLTDHFSNYSNRYFDSVFDDDRNVNGDLVCSASTMLLRTLIMIGSPRVDPSELTVNCSVVNILLDCLTRNVTCSDARDLLPKFEGAIPEFPSHYPSVFQANRFSLHQRFVHDWVFDRSAHEIGKSCTNGDSSCGQGWACVRSLCKKSRAKYLDATSDNVKLIMGEIFWYYQIVNETSTEPLWAESDWTPIGLRTYQMSNPVYDFAFAAIAVLIAAATVASTLVLNRKFNDWVRVTR